MPYEQIQDKLSNPSPITHIYVFNPFLDNRNGNKVKVIIDTGAGVTSLPESIIAGLGTLEYTIINIRSPLDKSKVISKKLYRVHLELQDENEKPHEHEIEVLAIPRNYGIIGRDILDKYKIFLDSPNKQWGFKCRWNDRNTCDSDNCIVPISS
jgi:hypothetical protein